MATLGLLGHAEGAIIRVAVDASGRRAAHD